MKDPDVVLLDRLFDGDLSPDEEADILAQIESASGGAAQIAERALLHAGLRQALRQQELQQAAWLSVVKLAHESSARTAQRRIPVRRRWLATWAVAACLTAIAAGTTLLILTTGSVSAASVVRQALKAHSAHLDRCYRVQVGREAELPPTEDTGGPTLRVWTRGDRFFVESISGEGGSAWGRDDRGRLWFAASPQVGALIGPDELPDRLAQVAELRSLQLESLLQSVLADFDLRRDSDSEDRHLIRATLKEGRSHPRYRAALLEIEAASGLLRRVVVQRVTAQRSAVPVSFTLVETNLLDDSRYTLSGHLSAGATIYDRHSLPGQRSEVFSKFLRLHLSR